MIVIHSEEEEHQRGSQESVPYRGPSPSKDDITSNCDYQSDVFKEQLSELEYSKIIADSEEKEPPTEDGAYRTGNSAKLRSLLAAEQEKTGVLSRFKVLQQSKCEY